MRSNVNKKTHLCEHCKKQFQYLSKLKLHLKTCKILKTLNQRIDSSSFRKCEICDFHTENYYQHLRSYSHKLKEKTSVKRREAYVLKNAFKLVLITFKLCF